jgi:mannose-6-phosphate isomerase
LKGFRSIASSVELLESFCPHSLTDEIKTIKNKNLKLFFQSLMELSASRKDAVITESIQNAEKANPPDIIGKWLLKLYRQYPSDIGVISPLFLNLFSLEPGQALFLPAGELHAYLDGMGIELMANSDNVLRGGLTPKHVDIPELLNVLNFVESDINVLMPKPVSDSEELYPVFAEEFQLSAIAVNDSKTYTSLKNRSAEILLCIDGNARVSYKTEPNESVNVEILELHKGDSVLIPAAMDSYQINGNAKFYKAGVPL